MIQHEQSRMAAICGTILGGIDGVIYAVETDTEPLRGKVIFVSNYVERLLGYAPTEFIDNPALWFSIIHPDDQENVQSTSFQIQTSKQPHTRVYRVRHKNSGKYHWMEDRVTPQIDEQGTFKGYLGIACDITKWKEARERDTNELTYERIVESIPDAILVVNSRGIIVNANLQAETMFGYTLTELMNKAVESLMPESFREKHVHHREEYASHPGPRSMGAGLELKARRKDGTEFPVDIALAPVRTDGTFLVVCTIRDITERKLAGKLKDVAYSIMQAGDSCEKMDVFFQTSHRILSEVLSAENFYIALYDDNIDVLSFPYFVDKVDIPPPQRRSGKGLTEYVIRTGTSLLCDKVLHEKMIQSGHVKLHGVPCLIWLGVPLKLEHKTIGAMAVQHYTDPNVYGNREQEILEYVSSHMAKVIHCMKGREMLKRFSGAVEQTADAVMITDKDGYIEYVNSAFEGMTGYTAKEVIGHTPRILKSGEHTREFYQSLWSTVLSGQVWRSTLIVKKKNGELVYVEETISPIFNEGRVITHFVSTERDVTERIRLDAALKASEQSFRNILEKVRLLVVILDPTGTIAFANNCLLEVTGWEREDVVGHDWFDEFLPRTVRSKARRNFDRGIETGEFLVPRVDQILTHDGKVRFVIWNNIVLHNAEGKIVAVTKIGEDVTEWKRTEDELQASYDQLRLLTDKLEASRYEERMRISREIHDVLGQVLTALDFEVNSLRNTVLQAMGKEAKRSMIDQISLISNGLGSAVRFVQSVANGLRTETIDPLSFVHTLQQHVGEFQERTGIRCTLKTSPRMINLDQERSTALVRILQESLTNVARHAQATMVNVTLKKGQNNVVLSIQDNGRGIKDSEASDHRSLGIRGMRERVIEFGGTMKIRGVEGGGTSITVRLPSIDRTRA